MRNSICLPPGRIETKIPLPHTNCSLSLYAVSTWKLQEDIPPTWTAHRRCKHTDKMLAGNCEFRSCFFFRQHEPIVAPKSLKLPKSYRMALFSVLPPLACYWRLREVFLVQVDGTSCVQYVGDLEYPEVRMFLQGYSFTIIDRIFACRKSTLAQKASPRSSSIANDSASLFLNLKK